MLLIITLFICILNINIVTLAEEQIPILTEETKHLISLDDKICKLLNCTNKEDGDNLLEFLEEYLQKFKEFDHLVQKNGTYFSDSAFFMMKLGMPLFVKTGYNGKQLATYFEWSEEEFKTFSSTMNLIRRIAALFPLHCQNLVYSSFEELLTL